MTVLRRFTVYGVGAQWLSGRVLDWRPRGRGFKPHRHYCVVSLSENINPSLVLVQPRKIRPFITERLLMGCKESNQTIKKGLRVNIVNTVKYETLFHNSSSSSYSLTDQIIALLKRLQAPFLDQLYLLLKFSHSSCQ